MLEIPECVPEELDEEESGPGTCTGSLDLVDAVVALFEEPDIGLERMPLLCVAISVRIGLGRGQHNIIRGGHCQGNTHSLADRRPSGHRWSTGAVGREGRRAIEGSIERTAARRRSPCPILREWLPCTLVYPILRKWLPRTFVCPVLGERFPGVSRLTPILRERLSSLGV